MPIFEYKCHQCEKEFERLVFSGEETNIACPGCNSQDVVKNWMSLVNHTPGKIFRSI